MNREITSGQRHVIRHALGLGRSRYPYRNHYATQPDDPEVLELVEMGLMERGSNIPGGLAYFHVTGAGRAAIQDGDS